MGCVYNIRVAEVKKSFGTPPPRQVLIQTGTHCMLLSFRALSVCRYDQRPCNVEQCIDESKYCDFNQNCMPAQEDEMFCRKFDLEKRKRYRYFQQQFLFYSSLVVPFISVSIAPLVKHLSHSLIHKLRAQDLQENKVDEKKKS